MTQDHPLSRATELLRGGVFDVGDMSAMPERRDEAIAKLSAALRARAAQQRRRRVLGGFAIAAGFVAIASAGTFAAMGRGSSELGRVRDPAGAVTAVRDGHAEAVGAGARVAEGSELRTAAAGDVHLEFDTGTRVTLGSAARVRLVEQSRKKRFALEAGSLEAKVAKLGEGERFVVATPDAEIEVRGTAFRVSLVSGDPACGGGTPTRLEVTEGTVVVRHAGAETRVSAGDRWPSCTAPVTEAPKSARPAPPAPAATAPAARSEATPSAAPAHAPQHASSPVASSPLAEQNDLFDQAMRAKRDGRAAAAIAAFDKLLSRYPGGPLSENATIERMRLLATTDRARGAAAARDYLRRWPHGFARAEAESLTSASP